MEYRTLSNLFGIGRSTVASIIAETCRAVSGKLMERFVTGEQLKEVVKGFESVWGFPQVAGAIDGSHLPIVKPQESPSDYYNRKNYYSIIVQGLVDFRGRYGCMYRVAR